MLGQVKDSVRTVVPTISVRLFSPRKLFLLGALLFAVSGLAQANAAPSVVVAVPVVNMFSAAKADSDVVSQAIYGTVVVVLEENPGWARVRTPDEYSGWLRTDEVRRISLSELPYATSGKTAQVSGLTANLYREPDVTAHQPLLTIPFESHLEITAEGQGDDGRWLQVRLVDGCLAWVQRGDLDLTPRKLTIAQSVALGRRFLGTTYTWAGTSSLGFDCSGFTQMLVRSRGIIMPRDADLQAAWSGADSVDRKRLRPGDLLFFGSSADHITHTGMFIGHGQFIHDTTYGHPGVQISRLKDQPWTHLLVACRRTKRGTIGTVRQTSASSLRYA
jgi:gamma-D-glutamyl-L-lysine dipeptidyl-peptidase